MGRSEIVRVLLIRAAVGIGSAAAATPALLLLLLLLLLPLAEVAAAALVAAAPLLARPELNTREGFSPLARLGRAPSPPLPGWSDSGFGVAMRRFDWDKSEEMW